MKLRFEATGAGNEVLACEDFYISYLQRPAEASAMLGELARLFIDDERLTAPISETALVTGNSGRKRCRILEGDFRKDYLGIASRGLDACIAFFNSQRDEHGGVWSTEDEDRGVKQ